MSSHHLPDRAPQIEKYADIYTSRVSNMLPYTPYKQFLCPQQSLAHSTRSPEASFPMKHWQVHGLPLLIHALPWPSMAFH